MDSHRAASSAPHAAGHRVWSTLWPASLVGRLMLVVGAVLALQLGASIVSYLTIERETLREDNARRIAELLSVGRRVHALESLQGRDVGAIMTTRHVEARVVSERPAWPVAGYRTHGPEMRNAIVRWEPELHAANILIGIRHNAIGDQDLVGMMQLDDGSWLTFRLQDFARMWPTAARLIWITVLLGGLYLAFAVLFLNQQGRPLRDLARAARSFGRGPHAPVVVSGPADLMDLGRAFNEMQDRITGLIEDQARSMEAISHDLRTPLARMQLATQFAKPADVRTLFSDNVAELDDMLSSLSAYLRAQHHPSEPEETDLAALARSVVEGFNGQASYQGPETLSVFTHRAPLQEALKRLIDNAARYGGAASVTVLTMGDAVKIQILDHGPGMHQRDLDQIYRPFFRADPARSRDTPGFGLGVPTAARLLTRFGGDLDIANAPGGGLIVTVTPPAPAPAGGAGGSTGRHGLPHRRCAAAKRG